VRLLSCWRRLRRVLIITSYYDVQPNSSNTCMVAGLWTCALTTDGTRSRPQLPKVDRLSLCKRTAEGWTFNLAMMLLCFLCQIEVASARSYLQKSTVVRIGCTVCRIRLKYKKICI